MSVYALVYRSMHSCILFTKAKVMFSVKADWITSLDFNFLSKIVCPAAQRRSAVMYTCLNHLILHFYGVQFNLSCTTLHVKGLNNARKRRQNFDGYMSAGSK